MTNRIRVFGASLLMGLSFAAVAGHRFHASALAVGGDDVSSVASVSLASTGGNGATTVRDYDDGFVRFSEATSVVSGSRNGMNAITSSVVTIRNLEIGGRIRADLLVAQLNESHPENASEAEMTFEGSAIHNLTIDGLPVDTTLDTGYFTTRGTYASMTADRVSSRFGNIVCSARGQAQCTADRQAAWAIRVPGLGMLTIGEVFVRHGHRQLNLLRLDREGPSLWQGRRRIVSHDGGGGNKSVVLGSVEGNGSPILP